jgi:hypothetical protein
MQPIAIAFKDYRVNQFTDRGSGELVIIHQCLNCGKTSPNRIAGDDNEYRILSILKESVNLNADITTRLRNIGLEPITTSNKEEAFISLFGINYQKYIKTR